MLSKVPAEKLAILGDHIFLGCSIRPHHAEKEFTPQQSVGYPKNINEMRKGIITVDANKCLSCKSCELACFVVHSKSKKLEEAIEETTSPTKGIFIEQIPDHLTLYTLHFTLPLICRHCEDAPCIKVCPSKSLKRTNDDSPVIINNELYIGCKECVMVCPFGVIIFDSKKKVIIKCDLCIGRLEKGEDPACIFPPVRQNV